MSGGAERAAADDYLRSQQDIVVGLIGPHELLERIVLAAGLPGPAGGSLWMTADGPDDDSLHCRLLTAAYADEQEAPEKARRLAAADACLFASAAPLAYARRAGVLRCPAVHIDLADGPLITALLRASQAGDDPARASFDTFTRPEVARALGELGLSARRLHVREEITTPAAMASYHARLWKLGQTSVAVTCLDEVARRLAASEVPAIAVQPSDHAIASALRLAILLAERHALTAAQLAVALIEIPELRDRVTRRTPRQAREELRLAVHGLLVHEAMQLDATVSPVSDHGFLVVATRGSLANAAASGELPFRAAAARVLGVSLDVGVGTGRTQRQAEDSARKRLAPATTAAARRQARIQAGKLRAAADPAGQAPGAGLSVADTSPSARLGRMRPAAAASRVPHAIGGPPPLSAEAPWPAESLSRLRSLETLTRLAQKLTSDAAPVVDAELTGRLLSVTPRTARRHLRALADQGLALPLPPRRSRHPGRPRQAYRLVVEELGREAVR